MATASRTSRRAATPVTPAASSKAGTRRGAPRRAAKKPAAAPGGPRLAPVLDTGTLTGFTGYRVRRAELHMRANFDRTTRRLGLRPAEFSLLVLIADNPGATQAALAAALSIARPNMVGLVDRLEQRGLVRRTLDDADRRSHGLSLTAKGAAQNAEAQAMLVASEAAALGHLTARERTEFVRLLGRLCEPMNDP